jgi:hypothetical protein
MNLNRFTAGLMDLDTPYVSNHFTSSILTTLDVATTLTDTGTAAVGAGSGGFITITPSDGTVADNDEAYIATPNSVFKFGTNRGIFGKCRLKFTETAATIYNVGFGFMNSVGADTLIDNGGGPKLSGSTLAIYKTDGSGVWKAAVACNGVAQTGTSTTVAVGATWYVLEIECLDYDGVNMNVTFKVDGSFLKDSNSAVIRFLVPIASATDMSMWAGAKLGAATNNDTTLVDYWYGATALSP